LPNSILFHTAEDSEWTAVHPEYILFETKECSNHATYNSKSQLTLNLTVKTFGIEGIVDLPKYE
jgi:hypothetical protein